MNQRINSLRWRILDLFALWHALVCGVRMSFLNEPSTRWLHDRPDWFVKYMARPQQAVGGPNCLRLHMQARVELRFRRMTGVSK